MSNSLKSIAISFALAVIPVPPTTLSVRSPALPPPVKPVPATTAVTSPTLSASIVNEFATSSYVTVMLLPPTTKPLPILSSSASLKSLTCDAVISIACCCAAVICPCALTVNVGVCEAVPYVAPVTPVFVIAISFAFTVIPVPAPMSNVTSPDVPPVIKPAPATTLVTSPDKSASKVNVPAVSSYVAVMFAPPTINDPTLSSTLSLVKYKPLPSAISVVVKD